MTLDVDEIEKRAEAATPAPWEHVVHDKEYMARDEVNAPCGCCGLIASKVAGWDAAFIAAARQDIPLLVAEVRSLRAENASLRAAGDYSPFNPDDPRNQPGGDDLPLVNAYLKIPGHDRLRRALAYDGLVAEVRRLSVENKAVIAQLDRNAVANIASRRSLCDQRNELKAEVERLRRELDAANGGDE